MFTKNIVTLLSSIGMLLLLETSVKAQVSYSQYLHAPLFTNPTDITVGSSRQATLNYRRQGNGEEDRISAAAFTYTQPLVNGETGRTWAGFGVSVMNEQAGFQGMLGNTGLQAAYAQAIHLNDKMVLSTGLQVGVFKRAVDMSRITTSSQYSNGSYNGGLATGEEFNFTSRTYVSLSPGIGWNMLDEQGARKAFLGVAWYNANQPNVSYTTDQDHLPASLILNGGYRVLQKNNIELTPTFRHISQSGGTYQTNLGMLTSYLLPAKGGAVKEGSIGMGAWYSVNHAAIVSLELNQPNYFISFSYDVPTTSKTMARRVNNAAEIAIGWRKTIKGKVKSKAAAVVMAPVEVVEEKVEAVEPEPVAIVETPVQAPVAATLEEKVMDAPPSAEEKKIFTKKLTFEFRSSKLDSASSLIVEDLFQLLQKYPQIKVEVVGYTDNIGSFAVNMRISQARSESIKAQLVKEGIAEDRITTLGQGFRNPVATNDTEEGRQQNRRIEFRLIE